MLHLNVFCFYFLKFVLNNKIGVGGAILYFIQYQHQSLFLEDINQCAA